jgi:hypothetical protein
LLDTVCVDEDLADVAVEEDFVTPGEELEEEAFGAVDNELEAEVRQVPNPFWQPAAQYADVRPHHPYLDKSDSLFDVKVMGYTHCEQQSPKALPWQV